MNGDHGFRFRVKIIIDDYGFRFRIKIMIEDYNRL